MCGQPIWGIAGAAGCSYLAYISYSHLRKGEFGWPHDTWTIVTYGVWIVLLAGLLFEPRCWRERVFFALATANFSLGFALAVQQDVSTAGVRKVRAISVVLWSLAALASLITMFSSGSASVEGKEVGS
jgi:hypothetical protein